jgi:ATP-dependent Lon protease
MVIPLFVGRDKSIRALDGAMANDKPAVTWLTRSSKQQPVRPATETRRAP